MTERRIRAHWEEMPEFRTIYTPWSNKLIHSESVRKITSKIAADQIALKLSGATLLPNLDHLHAPVTIGIDGKQRDYVVGYDGEGKEEGEDNIAISDRWGDHSILLHPSRESDHEPGYEVTMSLGKVAGFHALSGTGHDYSPYPFIEAPGLRSYAEQVISKVSEALLG